MMQNLLAVRQKRKGAKTKMNKAAKYPPMRRLATLRKNKGLTQKELANQVGVKVKTIYYYEAGTRFPNYATLRRLSKVLDVAIDDIVEA